MKKNLSLSNLELATAKNVSTSKKPVAVKLLVNDNRSVLNSFSSKSPAIACQTNSLELRQALSNPLFSQVRTIEIDSGKLSLLQKDLAEIAEILFKTLPSLSHLTSIADTLNSDRAIECITEFGRVVKSHSGQMDVVVSIEATGNVDGRVQTQPESFENLVAIVNFIQRSDLVSNCELKCTVNRENVYSLHDLLEFALSKNIYISYTLAGLEQLDSDSKNHFTNLTFEEKYHFAIFLENTIKFYEKSNLQQTYYQSLISLLMHSKPFAIEHARQHETAIVFVERDRPHCVEEILTGDRHALPPNIALKSHVKDAAKSNLFSPQALKELKILKPLKLFRQQLYYRKLMATLGIDMSTILNPKPADRFPRNAAGKRKVMICGWYGTETLGDKAILGGVVNSIKAALGDFELHLVSLELYISQMTALQMPELQGCTLHSVTDAIALASSMDLVVFGGGPLMIRVPMAEMLAIFQKAVAAQVPTLLAGCGVGPLGVPHYDEAIRLLLLHSSHRIYRDRKSLQLAQSLGIDTTSDRVAEDPAFTWLEACTSTSNISVATQKSQDCPKLLLGLRDWPYDEFAEKLGISEAERLKQRFENEVIIALELLVKQYNNLKIIPFPMCTNHIGRDDRWFYRRLFRNRPSLQTALELDYLGAELSPLEAIDVFQSASVALTMRFHSLVFALANHVPVVAIDYTLGRGKVKSLAEKYNVPHESLDSITGEFMFSSLSALLANNSPQSTFGLPNESLTSKNAVVSFVSSLS